VLVWYPGCEGGHAVADVLFATHPVGQTARHGAAPHGRPAAIRGHAMRNRTYRFATAEPLYPFGFGLSYAKLSYGPLKLSGATLGPGQEVTLQTTLSNTATARSTKPCSAIWSLPPSGPMRPGRRWLISENRRAARSTVPVIFKLSCAAFAQFDAAGRSVHVAGRYGLVVGSASPARARWRWVRPLPPPPGLPLLARTCGRLALDKTRRHLRLPVSSSSPLIPMSDPRRNCHLLKRPATASAMPPRTSSS